MSIETEIREKRDQYMMSLLELYMNSSFVDFSLTHIDKIDPKNISKPLDIDQKFFFKEILANTSASGYTQGQVLDSMNVISTMLCIDVSLSKPKGIPSTPYSHTIMLSIPGNLIYKIAYLLYKDMLANNLMVTIAIPSLDNQSKGFKSSIMIASNSSDFHQVAMRTLEILEPFKAVLGSAINGLPSLAPYACYEVYVPDANMAASDLLSVSVDVGISEAIEKVVSYGGNIDRLSNEMRRIYEEEQWHTNAEYKKALVSELMKNGLQYDFEEAYLGFSESYYCQYNEMQNYTISTSNVDTARLTQNKNWPV